ncbi:asparaginase [Spirosoma utsteinense]|uniref:L-asparaginase n=1 Tax=Spirosoma utsteinense TaxID=2585773 RepID=A0ABR6WAY5_9BACT|nr:asparaginase [Spirosoma utsteinense]MBC3785703.1 L-asparaginase [Spirosoma utsteinense]MBC3793719.1 L-asparaginase [Spirosoma utsteinense]
MTYTTVRLNSLPETNREKKESIRRSVLVIYTGGTFGMVYDPLADQLIPFDFERVSERLPELRGLDFDITLLTLPAIIDSSNMKPAVWVELAQLIETHYDRYDSFVILHGTDTMAYTASALSFMLDGLSKPVLLTGAQLPIGAARTDARANFITALEIAAAVDAAPVDAAPVDAAGQRRSWQPIVSEVCVYFNSLLLRGNRSTKQESVQFNAFASENYPHLATAGVSIDYNRPYIRPYQPDRPLRIRTNLTPDVTILKLFPGITQPVVESILGIPALRGVVLETFGAGNAPTDDWFLKALKTAIDRGVLMINVSQCEGGRVTQGRYQTSKQLQKIGVVNGADITTEAAITKLMVLLGQEPDRSPAAMARLRTLLAQPISGEMSE